MRIRPATSIVPPRESRFAYILRAMLWTFDEYRFRWHPWHADYHLTQSYTDGVIRVGHPDVLQHRVNLRHLQRVLEARRDARLG